MLKIVSRFACRLFAFSSAVYISNVLAGCAAADSRPVDLTAIPRADGSTLRLLHFEENPQASAAGDATSPSVTLTGDAAWEAGKFGKALAFGGKNGRAKLDGDGVLSFAADESYTVEVWTKVLRFGSTQQ